MIEKTSYKKLWNIALVILHLLVVSNSLSSDIIAGGPEDGEGGHVAKSSYNKEVQSNDNKFGIIADTLEGKVRDSLSDGAKTASLPPRKSYYNDPFSDDDDYTEGRPEHGFGLSQYSSRTRFDRILDETGEPEENPFQFDGIENAVSVYEGEINLFWDPPTYNGEYLDISDSEDVIYHIFVALGDFEFETSFDHEALRETFESDVTKQYHNVTGEVFDYFVDTVYLGEIHTILVTAELNETKSDNTIPSKVAASEVIPIIRAGVDVKGVFVPTDYLAITLVMESVTTLGTKESGNITFLGLLMPEYHGALLVGDFFSGFTTDGDSFLLNVTSIVSSSTNEVVLEVETISVEDIFEELDLEFSNAISRDRNATLNESPNSRRLALKTFNRRLGWFSNFLDSTVEFISDSIDGVIDAIDDVLTFDVSKSFQLFNIRESFDIDLSASVNWSGHLGVRCDLLFTLRIRALALSSEVSATLSLSYSMETKLSAQATASRNWTYEKNLWKGKRKCKTFMLGKIPVIIHFTPKIDFKTEVSLEAEGSLVAAIGGSGSTSVSMEVSTSNGVVPGYKAPTFNPTKSVDAKAKLSLAGHADLIFSGVVELYGGLLFATAGVKIGGGLDATIAAFQVEPGLLSDLVLVWEELEFNFRYGIPLSVGSVLIDEVWEDELFGGTTVILTLPEASITIGEHICIDEEAMILDIEINEKESTGLIKNGFSMMHDVRWWIGGEFYQNSWAITKPSRFEMFISRSVDPLDKSPAQVGPMYAAVVPEFPSFLLLPVMYQIDAKVLEVPCVNNPSDSPSVSPTNPPTYNPTPEPTKYPIEAPSCPPSSDSTGNACGDPHFKTFNDQYFSYHGQCDMVLSHSNGFADGLGLHIHIRTTRVNNPHMDYSYISGTAVKIGLDVVEVSEDGALFVNGAESVFLDDNEDYGTYFGRNRNFTIARSIKGEKKRIVYYDMILGQTMNIQIRSNTKTGMLFVDVNGSFSDSKGLLGASPTEERPLLSRDGMIDLTGQWNTYGEEWQVNDMDPKLFRDNARRPQYPHGCLYEADTNDNNHAHVRRRLMDSRGKVTLDAATNACAHLKKDMKRKFCVDDVMATGDLDILEDPFYYN